MFRKHGPDKRMTRAVGLALSLYANTADGRAFPSQSKLARDLATTARTVSDHLATLEEAGWLLRTAASGRTTRYQLTLPDELADDDPEPDAPAPPAADEAPVPDRDVQIRREPSVAAHRRSIDVSAPDDDDSDADNPRNSFGGGGDTPERASGVPDTTPERASGVPDTTPERASGVGGDTPERASGDPRSSFGGHKNSQETHSNYSQQASCAPAQAPARESSDHQTDDYSELTRQIHGWLTCWDWEVDLDKVATLADDLDELPVDPDDYLDGYLEERRRDGLLDRMYSWKGLRRALLEDLGDYLRANRIEPNTEPAEPTNRPPEPEPDHEAPPSSDPEPDEPTPPPDDPSHPPSWQAALHQLRDEMPPDSFDHWIKPIQVDEIDETGAVLVVETDFFAEYVGEVYLDLIADALGVDVDAVMLQPQRTYSDEET